MTFIIEVRPDAERDVEAAIGWYQERAPDQVVRLIDEIARIRRLIRDSPNLYPDVYRSKRRAPLQTFPYFLWYSVDDAARCIELLALTHQSEDPDKVKPRLR